MGKKKEIKKEIIPEYKSSSEDSDSGSEIVISKKNIKDKAENKLSLKKNVKLLSDSYNQLLEQSKINTEIIAKLEKKLNKQKLSIDH